jgi:hypothetical protein
METIKQVRLLIPYWTTAKAQYLPAYIGWKKPNTNQKTIAKTNVYALAV